MKPIDLIYLYLCVTGNKNSFCITLKSKKSKSAQHEWFLMRVLLAAACYTVVKLCVLCVWWQDMKPVPLLLLLSSVLLSSHLRPAAGRPRALPGWLDGSGRLQTQRLDEVLLRAAAAGDSAASDPLGDNLLRLFQRRTPDPLLLLPSEEESRDEAVRTAAAAAQLLKRSEEPPLSIDLTFHLLRNMIQMAKMESQREQAQLNRKVLDEVGK